MPCSSRAPPLESNSNNRRCARAREQCCSIFHDTAQCNIILSNQRADQDPSKTLVVGVRVIINLVMLYSSINLLYYLLSKNALW